MTVPGAANPKCNPGKRPLARTVTRGRGSRLKLTMFSALMAQIQADSPGVKKPRNEWRPRRLRMTGSDVEEGCGKEKAPAATFITLSVPRPNNKHFHVLEPQISSSSDNFSNIILPQ